MLGLMSLWADRCPFQSNCGKVSSVGCVGGVRSEKRRKEVRKKNTLVVTVFTAVECKEKWCL